MRRTTPLGALIKGLLAGAAGAGAQTLFFTATTAVKLAPEPLHAEFDRPEHVQNFEPDPTQTVARRVVEQLAQRGPISDEQKALGGQFVHHGFGAGWGGLYGLARESVPGLCGPAGALGFGTLVFVMGDLVILPGFRLGAPPRDTPARNHAFGLAAHLVYGLTTWGAYEVLDRAPWLALAALALLRKRKAAAPAPELEAALSER